MSDLKSVLTDVDVASSSPTFSVRDVGNAYLFEDFDSLSGTYKNSDNTIDSSISASGGKSVSMNYQSGVANAGGWITSLPDLVQGDEIWSQVKARFQPGWLFNDSAGFKFLRYRVRNSTGGHRGYLDLYNASSRFNDSAWYFRNELKGDNNSFGSKLTQNVDTGTFHKYEFYVKLHSGSSGIVRVWRDNVLLYEELESNLASSGDKVSDLYVSTHFNPDTKTPFKSYNPESGSTLTNSPSQTGAPQNQSCHIDDFTIYISPDSVPTGTDSNGNRFIG